jgi:DDE superfamily endonuclease
MGDNTDFTIPKPISSDAQRSTYSQYYASNVGKGGVFVQPCGYTGTHELWDGAVSDSDYMERSGVLQQQETYTTEQDFEDKCTPFTNIMDKGYRIRNAAWRVGGQFILQPTFASSGAKFSSYETIHSVAVAADRSANERAVNLAKKGGYIAFGLRPHESVGRLSDVWLVWSFQANFFVALLRR